jgi:CRP-like cAMP-binding protein
LNTSTTSDYGYFAKKKDSVHAPGGNTMKATFMTFQSGELFGEEPCLYGTPYSLTIIASTADTVCYTIPAKEFTKKFFVLLPQLRDFYMKRYEFIE